MNTEKTVRKRSLLKAVLGATLAAQAMLQTGSEAPANVPAQPSSPPSPSNSELTSCAPDLGLTYRGILKKKDGRLYRCDGDIWQEIQPGPQIGEYDPIADGIRLDAWPEDAQFSHWITPPAWDAAQKRWERISCYSSSEGLGCDVRFEVPPPTPPTHHP